ncbi:hypothetical protein LUZ60_010654 [Juncus effusus]|nr:hypothetical protein LUZ60_010654 [Juncus effusus]
MEKTRQNIFLSLPLFVALLLLSAAVSAAGAGTSIHELLKAHGLPAGILPKSSYISSFTLDSDTGLLTVNLTQSCYARYADSDLAFFDNYVTGNLSFGSLNGVNGLQQEELFVWLPVKGILIEEQQSGVLLFDIGLAHKRLSRSLFEDPPDCQTKDGLNQDIQGVFGRREGPQVAR